MVEWLLGHGANVSVTSSSGESAISVAALEDKYNIVWRLHEVPKTLLTREPRCRQMTSLFVGCIIPLMAPHPLLCMWPIIPLMMTLPLLCDRSR